MAGPYFEEQKASKCGCYFPDVTVVGHDPRNGSEVLYCVKHGKVGQADYKIKESDIPSEAWRESERIHLRGKYSL
jgi:hypothetical protein